MSNENPDRCSIPNCASEATDVRDDRLYCRRHLIRAAHLAAIGYQSSQSRAKAHPEPLPAPAPVVVRPKAPAPKPAPKARAPEPRTSRDTSRECRAPGCSRPPQRGRGGTCSAHHYRALRAHGVSIVASTPQAEIDRMLPEGSSPIRERCSAAVCRACAAPLPKRQRATLCGPCYSHFRCTVRRNPELFPGVPVSPVWNTPDETVRVVLAAYESQRGRRSSG